ncbi:DNA cytosine methyltransferase [Oscillatoria sp. FACHB-1406]|uniref:DNA cytosine methyltransferase n=1 Tax=Oscillatoria sp. FACHB-1406 TaxID=2692846 RepID=UPI0016899100|nr:DNA cytosine methyltransferase [Oscillatoria sp. FACHB-1406]MBD2579665.1 DNA cytosine methyltransferase [Oscillatoria sp. FACHB-1406]
MATKTGRPIAIDLFAGAGGFSLGVEQAGFDVAIAVEYDPIHAAVHAFNFPRTRVLQADISTFDAAQIRGLCDRTPDLLVGGPPCQGFSTAGLHNLKDDRNSLIFHFCRWVSVLQPRYFVMENVPGLTQGQNKTLLRRLKHDLRDLGYKITEPVRILNAADFGVPQNRSRLFLLGARLGERLVSYPQPLDRPKVSIRDAIADLPNLDSFPELAKTDEVLLARSQIRYLNQNASNYAKTMRRRLTDTQDYAYRRHWNPSLLTCSRQTQHTPAIIERFSLLPPGKQDGPSHFYRLDWEGRSVTLRAGTGSERGAHTAARPLHPEYHRVISVREAARLHSFPDWFRLHATKWHGFREVGNAVPPLLARAIARQILQALGVEPVLPRPILPLGERQLLYLTPKQAARHFS